MVEIAEYQILLQQLLYKFLSTLFDVVESLCLDLKEQTKNEGLKFILGRVLVRN